MRSLLHAPRTRKRSIAAATLGALALIGSLLVATPAQALNDTGTGGVFVPSTGRILDTAKGTGGYSTPMESGTYRTIKVAGLAGLPDDGSVGAVSLNATVGASSGAGILYGRPNADAGSTTMLIYSGVSGEYTSNTATLAVGSDGTIQVMTQSSARLILDVQGYYTANTNGTAAGGFVPVSKRIVITRSGIGAPKAAIAPGKSIDVQVAGANGVPAGASGVVANLIAINTNASDGYLTPYATGATKPVNSLHYTPSQNTSIQAQVPLSADGKMTIANSVTTVDLIVDLQGYFTAAGQGGAVFTPASGRAYDSRATGNTALGEQEIRSIQIAGTAGVPVMGSGITAVVLTLTVVHAGGDGFADVYADGTTNPGITAINFNAGEIQTNTITVPLGANGKVSLRNAAKATNYVIDVQGWYANPQTPTIVCKNYANGTWAKTIPSSPATCGVTVPAAVFSGQQVRVELDGTESALLQLDTAAQTTVEAAIPNTPGQHSLRASLVDADDKNQTAVSAPYAVGFGDWASAGFTESPTNNITTTLKPTLSVQSATDAIDTDATVVFAVSTTPDMKTITARSEPIGSADGFALPDGVLESAHSYYWQASVTGKSGGSAAPTTVSSPVWMFTAQAPAADDVDWAVQSTDTFADAVNRAVVDNGASPTAASLSGLSDVLSNGNSTNFPGLSSLSTDDAADLASKTATAVSSGTELPAEAQKLSVDDSTGTPVATSSSFRTTTSSHRTVTLASAIYGGYAYEQTNWVKHWVVNSRGVSQLKDQVKLRWIVDPGNKTSRIEYNTLYSPSTGFFYGLTYQSKVREIGWLSQKDLASTGWRSGTMNGHWEKFLTTPQRMSGKTIDFTTELAVKHGKQRFSDWEASGDAKCANGTTSDCKF